ncbi:GAF and ANTAR domain-containing protein [Curtobacterium sp. HSID17257]|uniref:GAF and ANTAR domain-containing protein n=1 Tax=Curtobacterium sp. HSID17257 TaxID=2419510 RepID=UPI001EE95F12|nr:GAF and ANTAR domain-containing protein [Curtobacterium sp. HSID17257]
MADYDVVEVLQTLVDSAVELFDAEAGAIHLLDESGALRVVASTSDRSGFIGLLQLDAGEGPCIDAVTSGKLVTSESAEALRRRWPRFGEASREHGYAGVHAIPLRLRAEVIGSLNLFRETEGALNATDARGAQALADVATISVLQQRTITTALSAADQMQRALASRAAIEQAKGFVARALEVDIETARELLRRHARSTQRRLVDIGDAVVRGEIPVMTLLEAHP